MKDTTERDEAIRDLRESLPPGTTVFTVLRHVSASGMSRSIDAYRIGPEADRDGAAIAWRLSWSICKATGFAYDNRHEAIKVGGAGMDMGFHIVYSLSAALYSDGFGCIGERCPSNDHSNWDREYTPNGHIEIPGQDPYEHWHRDGGYALRHRWI